MLTATPDKATERMRVRCFAISNRHKQGKTVDVISLEFFPEAVDYFLSCGHGIRLNLKPEFWEMKA